VVADGLSHQWDNTERTKEDGNDWSVNPDPEAMSGLANDMFTIEKLPHDAQQL